MERSILSIAESGSVVKRKKSCTRTRKMTSFEPRPRGTGRSYSYINDCIVTLLIKELITNKIKEHLFEVPKLKKKKKNV